MGPCRRIAENAAIALLFGGLVVVATDVGFGVFPPDSENGAEIGNAMIVLMILVPTVGLVAGAMLARVRFLGSLGPAFLAAPFASALLFAAIKADPNALVLLRVFSLPAFTGYIAYSLIRQDGWFSGLRRAIMDSFRSESMQPTQARKWRTSERATRSGRDTGSDPQ